MTDLLRFASWGMLIGPLAFFYFYFVDWAVKTGAVPPATNVESIILVTMVLRLCLIMSFRTLRRGKVWVVVDIFSLEVLFTAVLLFLFIFTRTQVYFTTLTSVTEAWPAALLLVVPAFALYRFGAAVVERARLSMVIPAAIGMLALLLIPAQAATTSANPGSLAGISRLLLSVILGLGKPQTLVQETTVAGFLLYLGLMFYVVTTEDDGQNRSAALAVAAAGSLTALGWSVAGSWLTNDMVLLFVVPGVAILAIIWGSTRGD